ncbi:MAG: hypothetical protein V8Q85_06895 [Christensenellales bacterium]
MKAWDLRGGAAMLLAGLAAEGETIIDHAELIDRGYDKLDETLNALGDKLYERKTDAVKGEGNEPWREKAAEESHRLNLRILRRRRRSRKRKFEEEQIAAEETAENENSGEEASAADNTDNIDTEETENTAEPEAEKKQPYGEDDADAEQEENADPFADEPFFEAEEEDEEETKTQESETKRTVGEPRAEARRKVRKAHRAGKGGRAGGA